MHVLLGTDSDTALWICVGVALVYALLSGFWGVVVTDLVQFLMAMGGAFALAWISWNAVDGWEGLTASAEAGAAVAGRGI